MPKNLYFFTDFDSPFGKLRLVKDSVGFLCFSYFLNIRNTSCKNSTLNSKLELLDSLFKEEKSQLKGYFNGELKTFDIKISIEKGTDFQRNVWLELTKIPYGKAISYQELANRIGKPKAVRAVGNANGRNPLSVIIPCHRVLRKNGNLGGYSSGVDIKESLLKLEGIILDTIL